MYVWNKVGHNSCNSSVRQDGNLRRGAAGNDEPYNKSCFTLNLYFYKQRESKKEITSNFVKVRSSPKIFSTRFFWQKHTLYAKLNVEN